MTQLGAVGDGVADDWPAIQGTLDAGEPVVVPETRGFYRMTKPLVVPPGGEIVGRGRPLLRWVGPMSGAAIQTGGDDCLLCDLILDGDRLTKPSFEFWVVTLGHRRAVLDNVTVRGGRKRNVLVTGSRNAISGGLITDASAGPGVAIYGGSHNMLDGIDLTDNTGFCAHLDLGAHDNCLDGVFCTRSRLELIGITYSCWGNRVAGCHAEDTGDNGISVTGFENTLSNNRVVGCANDGIRVYGSRNSVTGNVCRDNGQSHPANGLNWSGVAVAPGWGGFASDNVVLGNVCIDTQAPPTQAYGVRLGRNPYPPWRPGEVLNAYPYRSVGWHVYKYAARATCGTVAPGHLDGTGSDGAVDWLYVGTAPGTFDPVGNAVGPNAYRGNRVADNYNGVAS